MGDFFMKYKNLEEFAMSDNEYYNSLTKMEKDALAPYSKFIHCEADLRQRLSDVRKNNQFITSLGSDYKHR